jgi:hypothetical protein
MVGGSGAGKSTFLRQYIPEGNPKPLSAPPQSATSTSSDIHAYIGSLRGPASTLRDLLLLDSEGL